MNSTPPSETRAFADRGHAYYGMQMNLIVLRHRSFSDELFIMQGPDDFHLNGHSNNLEYVASFEESGHHLHDVQTLLEDRKTGTSWFKCQLNDVKMALQQIREDKLIVPFAWKLLHLLRTGRVKRFVTLDIMMEKLESQFREAADIPITCEVYTKEPMTGIIESNLLGNIWHHSNHALAAPGN